MAVPKKRTSRSKNRMRQSSKGLKPLNISYDKDGSPQLSHFASSSGFYKGRLVATSKKGNKEPGQDPA